MKTSTPELRAILASRQFYSADLFAFTLAGGGVHRYTSGDRDITADGHLFGCGGFGGPFFKREGQNGLCRWKRGLEVDTMQFSVLAGDAQINGVSFLTACRRGVFDGAELELRRAYMPTYGDTSAGTVILFVGRVAQIEIGQGAALFEIASHLELLNQDMPRNLYQPNCVNTLFDASCGLDREDFAVEGTLAGGSTASAPRAALVQASGYFDLGVILFNDGPNAGVSRTIKSYTNGSPGTLKLISPLPAQPETGDAFTIYPGCNKTQAACAAFSNIANFRGTPFVPVAETAT